MTRAEMLDVCPLCGEPTEGNMRITEAGFAYCLTYGCSYFMQTQVEEY